jgi:NADPH:quinone reductase-like Zn-dependent oxidoreductase
MQAAQYTENSDDFNNLEVVNIEKPIASAGLAVVKLRAAAINPIDQMVMKGYLRGAGWAMPLPFTMGYDLAGVISDISAEDSGNPFTIGDEVFAVNWGQGKHDEGNLPVGGSFAEYILMPIAKLSRKPENISFEQAAAVALVGTTAHQCLFRCGQVAAGSRVLILGGASAVGAIAIQLAKSRGAWVATTCSDRTIDYVSQFGADKIVNYRESKWEEDPELKGLDVVFDTVGETDGFARTTANGVVKETGAFVSICSPDAGYDPAAHPPLSYAAFHCLANEPSVQDELASMLASGSLTIPIDKTLPFSEENIRELVKYQESGKSTGKNVLTFA